MGRDGTRALRVLAADDSTVMRGVMRTVFELHASQGDVALPRMELCGLVRDGVEALDAVRELSPDVLLLDLEMPRMTGLQVLEKLRFVAPHLPVIMCSAYTERGARSTLDALSLGAKDYVMKPGQQKDFAAALDMLMEQLLPKIAVLVGCGTASLPPSSRDLPLRMPMLADPAAGRGVRRVETVVPVEIVAIGISTGGPSALETMLPMLPHELGVPVLIVQHMPKLFTGALADRLNKLCRMPVMLAVNGMEIEPGRIVLAPGDSHMEVAAGPPGSRRNVVKLHKGAPLNSCMPSADYLFRSAAATYGAGTVALVMTGMGSDGCEGARAVREAGGTVLAQDEATSAVWGMPGRVARAGLASSTVALPQLAGAVMDRVRAGRMPQRMVGNESAREVLHGLL